MRRHLHRAALAEFHEAVRWYTARSPVAAVRFIDAVQLALIAITETPEAWPLRRDGGSRRDIRAFVLDRFPFAVVYRVQADEVRVLAIAHAKRHPGYWHRRR
jgi:plasmid stabilization system protein ParE